MGQGKGCDTFGPTGPWLVTPDEVGDFNNLAMYCDVDAKRYQNGTTATMVYKVPFLIAYCSRFMSLQPGDIISTGTPPGSVWGKSPRLTSRVARSCVWALNVWERKHSMSEEP